MNTLTVKLPEPLERKLAEASRHEGRSRSAIVRDALEAFLERRGAKDDLSALALAGRLAGTIEGPQDLSHNPVYLDDYGR